FQAEDGIRAFHVTGVQTCALPIYEIRSENYRSRYYLRAAHIDPGTNRMRDVVIYDLSVPSEPRTVYADSGHLTFSEDQTNLLMRSEERRVGKERRRRRWREQHIDT